MITQTLVIILFVIAMLFYVYYGGGSIREGFSNYRCPNVLIQKGKDFFLFNTKLAKVPGVNPLQFASLEDYKEFMDWQRSQGIKCPILYVQQGYDAQGQEVFQQRPDPMDPQGGLGTMPPAQDAALNPTQDMTLLFDAGRGDPPYNQNSYPSFDPHNQYIGEFTPLDNMDAEAEKLKFSGDAMDPNWSGTAYTQALVARGFYKDNEVYRYKS
jgi:hypothetical protein